MTHSRQIHLKQCIDAGRGAASNKTTASAWPGWCKNVEQMRTGCQWPSHVLANNDSALLPPMHSELTEAEITRCARSLDTRGALRLLFVGDSQTMTLMTQIMRWLVGGIPSLMKHNGCATGTCTMSVLPSNLPNLRNYGWAIRVAMSRIDALYGPSVGRHRAGYREVPSLATYFSRLNKVMDSLDGDAARGDSHLVLVVGLGVWDASYSYAADRVGVYKAGMRNISNHLLRVVVPQYRRVDLVLRNMFVSYYAPVSMWVPDDPNLPAQMLPDLEVFNSVIASEARRLARLAPAGTRVHLLDAWGLSWPRRNEMPQVIGQMVDGTSVKSASSPADGIHWCCVSRQTREEGALRCLMELATGRRADEVSWAAMQLTLLGVCEAEGLVARQVTRSPRERA